MSNDNQLSFLSNYFDAMTNLLLNHDIKKGIANTIATARTQCTLAELGGDLKMHVIDFLWGCDLIHKEDPVISLVGANLSQITVTGRTIYGIDLTDADMSGSKLERVTFASCNLSATNMTGSTLTKVGFDRSNIDTLRLNNSLLRKMFFWNAQFDYIEFYGCNIGEFQPIPKRVAEQIVGCLEADKELADDIGRRRIDAMIDGLFVQENHV
jgi:uncharacterized protein YjbI with pentapeptide repeats